MTRFSGSLGGSGGFSPGLTAVIDKAILLWVLMSIIDTSVFRMLTFIIARARFIARACFCLLADASTAPVRVAVLTEGFYQAFDFRFSVMTRGRAVHSRFIAVGRSALSGST